MLVWQRAVLSHLLKAMLLVLAVLKPFAQWQDKRVEGGTAGERNRVVYFVEPGPGVRPSFFFYRSDTTMFGTTP
jgi:hypothetical protein